MLPHPWLLLLILTSHVRARSPAPQFRTFYEQWRPWQLQISTEICNSTLTTFYENYGTSSPMAHFVVNACYNHTSCIIDNTPEAWKASMAAASVALGLLPTLLATIGPSIAETALLSSRRPLLALLLSLGAPATQPNPLFEYDDPLDLLGLHGGSRLVVPRLSCVSAALLSGLEYLAAVGAVGNTLQTSYQLGVATVSAASCTIWEIPLIWSLMSVVVHVIAAIRFYIRLRDIGKKDSLASKRRQSLELSRQPTSSLSSFSISEQSRESKSRSKSKEIDLRPLARRQHGPPADQPEGKKLSFSRKLWYTILQQSKYTFLPCSNLPSPPPFRNKNATALPRLAVLLAILASFTAYVQLVFGTVFLASLLFISVKDAVIDVMLRFVFSALLCKMVLLVEVGGLRGK